MAGWVGLVNWLTDNGRFTHKVVKRPSISLAQDRESSPNHYATPPTHFHSSAVN